MAFTLSTIYTAIDKYSPVLKKMEQANAGFAGKVMNTRASLMNLAGGVSVASLAFMGYKAITNYEDAIASLSAITGLSGKEFEPFKKEVMEVAARTKKSGVDVAKAFELIGSAKPELLKSAKSLSMVSEEAIVLSKASKDSLEVSAMNLAGAMNQFNLGADQAKRTINVLGAGAVVGAANITQVNEALGNVGAVAHGANMTLEKTVAAIEVLGSKQLFGAEAGTKLRGVILRLQAAGLGYKSGQFEINDALNDARNKMNLLTTAKQRDAYASSIFGAENITAGKIMLDNIKMLNEFTVGVTGTNIAYEQASKNSATFTKRLEALKAKFENLLIKGNETSGMLGFFGSIIGVITNNLGFLLGAIGTGLVLFAAWKALVLTMAAATTIWNVVTGISLALQGSYPIAMAANTVALTAFNVATKAAAIGTAIFNAVLAVNPFVWIALAIVAVIAGIVLLIKNFDAVKDAVIRFVEYAWSGIKKVGQAILSYMLAPLQLVLKLISAVTGAEWAKNMQGKINDLTGQFSLDALTKEKEQPVNTLATANNEQKKIIEQNNNKNLNLTMVDKTKGGVNLIGNNAPLPNLQDTYSY